MAISDSLNKRLRARRDEEEDEYDDEILSDEMEDIEEDGESDSDEDNSNSDTEDSQSDEEDGDEDNDSSNISDTQSIQSLNEREAIRSEFRQISFGALAKAQNSISKKRKRGIDDKHEDQTDGNKPSSTLQDIRERLRIARERKLGIHTNTTINNNNTQNNNGYNAKPKPPPRTSKHAPTVQSSKIAVSRKRTIIEPPTIKSRDPRFDPTVVKSSSSARGNNSSAEKAYAFLDEYRASEIKQLKEQLAKTKDANQKEELKRAITSATDRQRALENRKREREVLQEHKKREKQLIKEGKKSQPYFLKKSELKREVLKKKYESMGSKERAKALERRRKKVASKEKKDLPWARRGMEN